MIIGRSWKSAKLFIKQNYTNNINGDMPSTVKNVWYFLFLLSSWRAHVLLERNTNLINRFLYKKNFHWVFYIKISFYNYSVKNQANQLTRDHMWKCDKLRPLLNNSCFKHVERVVKLNNKTSFRSKILCLFAVKIGVIKLSKVI